jgi:anti-sigma regulatory factor (Ser/Thr protein kinase)
LVLAVPDDDGFMELVHDVTQRIAEHAGFDAATSRRVASAVAEVARGAVRHAGSVGPPLTVSFRDSGLELRVEVVDSGGPRDAAASAGASQVMDSVRYRRLGQRNVCSLAKRKQGTRRDPVDA